MFSLTYVLQRVHLAGAQVAGHGPHDVWIVEIMATNPIMQTIEDLRHALLTPVAPWTELVMSGHLAAVNQYGALDTPWLVPAPFLVVAVIFAVGALTFRSRARSFAENL
jgi:ABC-type polysaccharide/polyol phosphate export permease